MIILNVEMLIIGIKDPLRCQPARGLPFPQQQLLDVCGTQLESVMSG